MDQILTIHFHLFYISLPCQQVNYTNYEHRRLIHLWTLQPKGEQSDRCFVTGFGIWWGISAPLVHK